MSLLYSSYADLVDPNNIHLEDPPLGQSRSSTRIAHLPGRPRISSQQHSRPCSVLPPSKKLPRVTPMDDITGAVDREKIHVECCLELVLTLRV